MSRRVIGYLEGHPLYEDQGAARGRAHGTLAAAGRTDAPHLVDTTPQRLPDPYEGRLAPDATAYPEWTEGELRVAWGK